MTYKSRDLTVSPLTRTAQSGRIEFPQCKGISMKFFSSLEILLLDNILDELKFLNLQEFFVSPCSANLDAFTAFPYNKYSDRVK